MNELPRKSGISLKAQHYESILHISTEEAADSNSAKTRKPTWLEVHPENYMGSGGAPHHYLSKIREHYPLSMHGVGMSLGSSEGCSETHLKKLKNLVDRYQPEQVSEHIAWSHWNAHFFNDLLPFPYNEETLSVLCENIDRVQSALQRTILVENPSTYIDFSNNTFTEQALFSELTKRTGCGILLDINNVHVCAHNHGFGAEEYIKNFPLKAVEEIHLAGHSVKPLIDDLTICIDDHGSHVSDAVWKLYEFTLNLVQRPIASLIEWDTDVPELATLLEEASLADTILSRVKKEAQSA